MIKDGDDRAAGLGERDAQVKWTVAERPGARVSVKAAVRWKGGGEGKGHVQRTIG